MANPFSASRLVCIDDLHDGGQFNRASNRHVVLRALSLPDPENKKPAHPDPRHVHQPCHGSITDSSSSETRILGFKAYGFKKERQLILPAVSFLGFHLLAWRQNCLMNRHHPPKRWERQAFDSAKTMVCELQRNGTLSVVDSP